MVAVTTISHSFCNNSTVSLEVTGTAITNFLGFSFRIHLAAAIKVAPVAAPSSTKMTMRSCKLYASRVAIQGLAAF